MGSIRVVVAGYGPVYRAGLSAVLPTSDPEGRVAILAGASGLTKTVGLVRLLHPDVVITDLHFPEDDPYPVQRITNAYPGTRVLLLADGCDSSKIQSGWSQGASGYLSRPALPEDIFTALRTIAAGERYLEPGFAPAPVSELSGREELSEREEEVLRLLAAGYTNAEVARRLVISPRTVETHRSNLQRKLGLRTRAELARAAFSGGIAALPVLEESTSA